MRKRLVTWGVTLIAIGIGICLIRIPIGTWDGPTSSGVVYAEIWPVGLVLGVVGVFMIVRGLLGASTESDE